MNRDLRRDLIKHYRSVRMMGSMERRIRAERLNKRVAPHGFLHWLEAAWYVHSDYSRPRLKPNWRTLSIHKRYECF